MMNAFAAIFQTIITFCTAFQRFGNAADHLGRYVEGGAKDLADSAEVQRAANMAKLQASLGTTNQPALPKP